MTRHLSLLLAALCWVTLAQAQIVFPGGGGGGGGGSVTFNTTCPTSTQTGSTINYTNGVNAVAKTANYQLVAGDCGTTFDVSGTGVTMTMPTLASGYVVAFKNSNGSGGANVTISAGAGQTIDGVSTFTLAPLQYVQISASTTGTNYDAGTGAAGAAGSSTPTNVGYTSGNFYASGLLFNASATGTAWGTAGQLSCAPYLVSTPGMTIKAIGFGVNTADATPNYASVAVYTNGSNQLPNTLVDSIGTTAISMATTGAKSGTVANTTDTLSSGWYWVCAASNSTTGAMYGLSIGSTGAMGSPSVLNALLIGSVGAVGVSCTGTGTSTCPGPVWANGSANNTYAWPASLSGATWTIRNSGALVPAIALQAN